MTCARRVSWSLDELRAVAAELLAEDRAARSEFVGCDVTGEPCDLIADPTARMAELIAEHEVGFVNRVRTPAGVERYGEPIGTPIVDHGGRHSAPRPGRDAAGHPGGGVPAAANGKPSERRATGKYTGPTVITDPNSKAGSSVKAANGWSASDERATMLRGIEDQARSAVELDEMAAEASGRAPRGREELDKIVTDGLTKFANESRIAIRMKPARLKDLLSGDGKFLTMHTGGKGSAFPKTKEPRLVAEAAWFGEDNHPVYAYLSHQSVTDPTKDNNAAAMNDNYGGVKLFFGDHVRDQATVTIGDSLNNRTRTNPSPLNDPSGLTANHYMLDARSPGVVAKQLQMGGLNGNIEYVEAQLHGDVTLDDVVEAQVPNGTPAAVVKKLEARGITVHVYG